MITLPILEKLCPTTKTSVLQAYVDSLNTVSNQAQLTGHENRVAAFLAQVSVESEYFNFIEENLNYTAQQLVTTFHGFFPTLASAQPYAHQPQMIANKVYANEMGNGNEASGDGWSYRGRGLIQVTGKWSYQQFANYINKDLADAVAYAATVEGATAISGWFWTFNKLNTYVDANNFVALTKHINPGLLGLADREKQYNLALQLLSQD